MSATEQALEKVPAEKTPVVMRTADEFQGALQRWQQRGLNVLTPFTQFAGLAPDYGLMSSAILLSTDPVVGEVYAGLPFLKKDEFAISKAGLRKIAECAGISTSTSRTDPRTIRNYWEFKAVASYRGVDGSIVTREATKDWDLRDGSPQMKGWTANQIEEARKHGLRNCEARAINAAIREYGIRQKYTKAELAKPFAVVRVAFMPDMGDPIIKRMVTERALNGTSQLYAQQQPSPMPEPLDDEEMAPEPTAGPRQVGSGSTVKGTAGSSADAPPPPADTDPAPTASAVRIVDIKETSGVNPTTKRSWTKWAITDSQGVEHSTFSRTIHDNAVQLRDAKTWVEFDDEENGQYSNIVQLLAALPAADTTSDI